MDIRMVVATSFLETCGGMERVALRIAKHFDARVHCMYYDPEKTFPEFSELRVEAAGILPRGAFPGRRIATAIEAGFHFHGLKLKHCDLVNAHTTPSEWLRNRNSPVIWYCHSPNREAFDLYEWRMAKRGAASRFAYAAAIRAFRHFESGTVPKIEHVFANSKNTQARIEKYLRCESEVLYPGVDAGKFSCRAYENFFFYPSRFVPEKEHGYAIEAFRQFCSSSKGWKLVLAGGLPKGMEGYLASLRFLAGDLPVEFETNVSEERLRELYSRCFAVLYTPHNEDFGLVPLEGMASCKPCIARDEAGPRETISSSQDGFLVQSPQEMAKSMEWLSKNPDECERMGKAGRRKVQGRFTWEMFLKRVGQKAKELVEERGEGGRTRP